MTEAAKTPVRLRRGRTALAFSFLTQGITFALLVTRVPAVQSRYGVPDAALTALLAAVPLLAGVGSLTTGTLVTRVPARTVLRCSQPLVLLALLAVGTGHHTWHLAVALGTFGLAVGALDASMNMLGVSLQHAHGRSIMLGFHAAYSLGGIAGATLAWAAVRAGLPLGLSYAPVVLLLLPAVLLTGPRHTDGAPTPPTRHQAPQNAATPTRGARRPRGTGGRALVPLCVVMAVAYIGDSTVSNWSATYLRDVLGGSEALATLPYNAYAATTLLGRAGGDRAVRRFGAPAVVRGGGLLAACGFAAVAAAPGPLTGLAGFTALGLGLSVLVPQTFAAAGRAAQGRGPGATDAAVARLNVFTYLGYLVGAPLVGALGAAWDPRGAMVVPLLLVLLAVAYAGSFTEQPDRYGGGHERPRTVDVG
ncbi:MFS transporter [Streptomyces sp. DH12]|uniref:MFS transporter n=1 Tax=Streptomyces sp. DH12 TaxID=2857010 RepID=UPI001E658079|nr:MFS transporter [Streptomyces sp. DH12]